MKVIAPHASLRHRRDRAATPQCSYSRGQVLRHGISGKVVSSLELGRRRFWLLMRRTFVLHILSCAYALYIQTFPPFLGDTHVQHDRPTVLHKMHTHSHWCTHMHSHFKLLTGLPHPDLIFFSKGSFVRQPLPMK